MSRLRIFSGGTGNLQYDSDQSKHREQNNLAQREFNAGVLLLYAPTRNQVHSYVKLHRGAQEQFLAVYEDDSGSLIDGLKTAVEGAVAERNWKIVDPNQVNQEVFDQLGAGNTTQPNISTDEISEELNRAGKINFTAGDGQSAVGLFEFLRQQFPSLSIAITTSGRTGPVENVDIVIEIDKTYTHSRPSVGAEAAKNLHDAHIEADKDAVEDQLVRLTKTGSDASYVGRKRRIVTSLQAAGIEDRFGIVLRRDDVPSPEAQLFNRYAVSSFSLLLVAGLLLAFRMIAQPPNFYLTQLWGFQPLLWTDPIVTFPSWQYLLIIGFLGSVVLFSIRSNRRRLIYMLLPFKALIESLPVTRITAKRRRSSSEHAQAVIESLAQLQSRTTSDKRFFREAQDVFSEAGVTLTPREKVTKNQYRQRILGFCSGAIAGGIPVVVLYVEFQAILNFLSVHILMLTDISIGVVLLAITGRLAVMLLNALLSSPTPSHSLGNQNSPFPRKSHTSRQSTNHRHNQASPHSSKTGAPKLGIGNTQGQKQSPSSNQTKLSENKQNPPSFQSPESESPTKNIDAGFSTEGGERDGSPETETENKEQSGHESTIDPNWNPQAKEEAEDGESH